MKIKTKEDALLHCFDLWLWMAVTGSICKQDWPGWKKKNGYLKECTNNCPCCEYFTETKEEFCEPCLINWSDEYNPERHCNTGMGEFRHWIYSETVEERRERALEIAILALEAMKPLKEGEL